MRLASNERTSKSTLVDLGLRCEPLNDAEYRCMVNVWSMYGQCMAPSEFQPTRMSAFTVEHGVQYPHPEGRHTDDVHSHRGIK